VVGVAVGVGDGEGPVEGLPDGVTDGLAVGMGVLDGAVVGTLVTAVPPPPLQPATSPANATPIARLRRTSRWAFDFDICYSNGSTRDCETTMTARNPANAGVVISRLLGHSPFARLAAAHDHHHDEKQQRDEAEAGQQYHGARPAISQQRVGAHDADACDDTSAVERWCRYPPSPLITVEKRSIRRRYHLDGSPQHSTALSRYPTRSCRSACCPDR
jgi:hypothetical protein